MRINARNRTKIEGAWAPDRNDEYLSYQALIGAWPSDAHATATSERAPQELVGRLESYMQKAVREAKRHTSWIHEQLEYGRAVSHFVERTLAGRTAPRFLGAFLPFQRRVAQAGMVNSLAQLVLKLASPGVPDFYQGTELWDLSLVDPDNRRPVDFPARQALLDGVQPLVACLDAGEMADRAVGELLDHWSDGRIKLLSTACGLRFRRDHADLMLQGAYEPLEPQGAAAGHVIAFARHDSSGTLIAVVPRLICSLPTGSHSLPRGAQTWGDTRVSLPDWTVAAAYRHVLTGETVHAVNGHLEITTIFRTLPVALLWASSNVSAASGAT